MMMRKKGQEGMTLTTIIGIVLLLILLLVIGYMLITQTGIFGGNTGQFFGASSNVQAVVQGCQSACATNSISDYCTRSRDVVFAKNDPNNGKFTCDTLAGS